MLTKAEGKQLVCTFVTVTLVTVVVDWSVVSGRIFAAPRYTRLAHYRNFNLTRKTLRDHALTVFS